MSSWKNNGYIPSGMNGNAGYQNNNQNQMMYSPPPSMQQQQPPASPNGIETNGPRAKCDQVVFEAIAKAAEIVVGSRCWIDPNNTAGNNNTSSSSSRFNLFVPEVQGVR